MSSFSLIFRFQVCLRTLFDLWFIHSFINVWLYLRDLVFVVSTFPILLSFECFLAQCVCDQKICNLLEMVASPPFPSMFTFLFPEFPCRHRFELFYHLLAQFSYNFNNLIYFLIFLKYFQLPIANLSHLFIQTTYLFVYIPICYPSIHFQLKSQNLPNFSSFSQNPFSLTSSHTLIPDLPPDYFKPATFSKYLKTYQLTSKITHKMFSI